MSCEKRTKKSKDKANHIIENTSNTKIICYLCDNIVKNKNEICRNHKYTNKKCIKCDKKLNVFIRYDKINKKFNVIHKCLVCDDNYFNVNVYENRICLVNGCINKKEYGYTSSTTVCESHKRKDMKKYVKNKCIECPDKAYYGNTKALYCYIHKNNFLYFTENKSERENSISRVLQEYNYNFIWQYNPGIMTYRLDFLIIFEKFDICIEVDEYSHNSRKQNEDLLKMKNIKNYHNKPIKFIRYNPDNIFFETYECVLILFNHINNILNNPDFDKIDYILYQGYIFDENYAQTIVEKPIFYQRDINVAWL